MSASEKNLYDLTREALQVQDACNLSGVVHGFARAIIRLRELHPDLDTDAINKHDICILWADKIAHLTGTQHNSDGIHCAYSWAHDYIKTCEQEATAEQR